MPGEASNRTVRTSAILNVIPVSRVRAATKRCSNRNGLSAEMARPACDPGVELSHQMNLLKHLHAVAWRSDSLRCKHTPTRRAPHIAVMFLTPHGVRGAAARCLIVRENNPVFAGKGGSSASP